MAKRDIPEINAGSMADIAFLLLIFFLVTTTMDRDQAYKRRIPKKIDVPQPPVEIQNRNIFSILANSAGEVYIEKRDGRIQNLDDLSDKVLEFYQKNEKLTPDEALVAAANPNHPGNNYPFYTWTDEEFIKGEILKAEEDLEKTENTENVDPAIVDFKAQILSKWMDKQKALEMYGKDYLPEIDYQAHCRITVQQATTYELFTKIHSELNEAIFQLRDEASKEIFNESYGVISRRFDNDQSREDADKLSLLKLLYPDNFIEVKPKR